MSEIWVMHKVNKICESCGLYHKYNHIDGLGNCWKDVPYDGKTIEVRYSNTCPRWRPKAGFIKAKVPTVCDYCGSNIRGDNNGIQYPADATDKTGE